MALPASGRKQHLAKGGDIDGDGGNCPYDEPAAARMASSFAGRRASYGRSSGLHRAFVGGRSVGCHRLTGREYLQIFHHRAAVSRARLQRRRDDRAAAGGFFPRYRPSVSVYEAGKRPNVHEPVLLPRGTDGGHPSDGELPRRDRGLRGLTAKAARPGRHRRSRHALRSLHAGTSLSAGKGGRETASGCTFLLCRRTRDASPPPTA